MQPLVLQVDVEALHGAGQDVAEAAATLQQTLKSAGSGLAPAPQTGSTATAAAQKAETAWLADLQRLASHVDEYGRTLTTASKKYRSTDQASADALEANGPEVGR
ncbi:MULTISPECIES: WXG100 family type VII secretion target [unclassified Actinoplanes]|uniref:WXG100 family type VII secretion target n=1 Tax=unclassified Actinoplanes TaxID=2626549 RepID=UPI001E5B4CCC|nr:MULTISPECIES: WXG100 family type VII secretion target [unclassified Actinoplanes]